jgi:hypothetical protein
VIQSRDPIREAAKLVLRILVFQEAASVQEMPTPGHRLRDGQEFDGSEAMSTSQELAALIDNERFQEPQRGDGFGKRNDVGGA